MEIDETKAEEVDAVEDDSGPGAATPDRSDDETEDEDLDLDGPVSEPLETTPTVAQASLDEVTVPPPRRELPFGRPNTRSKPPEKKAVPAAAEDSETRDDEEL
jgi:hypothetical protein